MYWFYQTLCWVVFILGFPFFLLYSIVTGKHLASIGNRLGFFQRPKAGARPTIWIHGASVGEIRIANIIIKKLPAEQYHLVLTTMTDQGYMLARQLCGHDVAIYYAPLDLNILCQKVVRRINPSLYLCLETELWPAMLHSLRKQNCKTILLNGRISEGSSKRYKKIKGLIHPLLRSFFALATISKKDAQRFISLGAPQENVHICGNLKYDWDKQDVMASKKLADQLNINEHAPVFVCGSTHGNEEEQLIHTYTVLREKISGLVWILVPRHLRRIPEITSLLERNDLDYELFSNIKNEPRKTNIILVNTVGDLPALYSLATWIFCGGSLVDKGGHNIMEAAQWGKPVFYGPSMKDFADARKMLEEGAAGFTIRSSEELAQKILSLNNDTRKQNITAARSFKIASSQKGATERQLALVHQALDTLIQ